MLQCQIEKRNKNIIVCMHLVYLIINVWPRYNRKEREWDPRYMHLAMTYCRTLAKFYSYAKFCYVSDLALATLCHRANELGPFFGFSRGHEARCF
jgi:hypothetical protein